jgi:hypothetical protein
MELMVFWAQPDTRVIQAPLDHKVLLVQRVQPAPKVLMEWTAFWAQLDMTELLVKPAPLVLVVRQVFKVILAPLAKRALQGKPVKPVPRALRARPVQLVLLVLKVLKVRLAQPALRAQPAQLVL